MIGGLVLLVTGIVLFFPDSFSLNLVFLAAILHNLAALFGVAGVLAHIYLTTGANPGTIQAIFAGWVTKGWARLHHPVWYEKIAKKPAVEEEPTESQEEPAGEAPESPTPPSEG